MATIEDIKKLLEKKLLEKKQRTDVNVCPSGGYYDFPHTRNYDSDLGFLIKMYQELTARYDDLLISFDDFIKILNSILTGMEVIVTEEVNKLLQDGKISLDTNYIEETKTLQFIFKEVK